MKSNTKSSITLPPEELKLVRELQKRLGAKTKVEVIRQGLRKLKEMTDRDSLRAAYEDAAKKVAKTTAEELEDLDGLTNEGTDG